MAKIFIDKEYKIDSLFPFDYTDPDNTYIIEVNNVSGDPNNIKTRLDSMTAKKAYLFYGSVLEPALSEYDLKVDSSGNKLYFIKKIAYDNNGKGYYKIVKLKSLN